MKPLKIVLILAIVGILSLALVFYYSDSYYSESENIAEYEVTFEATWSSETHPEDFPPNPHFSGLIGATHNSKVTFWEEGQLASPGIKNMAEKGSKNPLNSEIDAAIQNGYAFTKLSGGGIARSPGSVSLSFNISKDFPFVTLVSMVAPSPDWFVGVSSLSLLENNRWVTNKVVILYAYDAGTDSGTTYTSPDLPTNPPEPINRIETSPFLVDGTVTPVGTFTFTKIS